jgi:signal transduction histidine kinase
VPPLISRLTPASERQFSRLVLACVAIGFAALIAAAAAVAWSVVAAQDHNRWVEHTYRVQRGITDIQVLTERLETSRRGFLLSGGARARDTFIQTAAAEGPAVGALRALTTDNPAQQRNVALVAELAARQVRLLGRSIAQATADPAGARAAFRGDGGAGLTRQLRALTHAMLEEERHLLAIRVARQAAGVRVLFVVLGVAGALLLGVAILSVQVIRGYTRDLVRTRAEVESLNDVLEQRVVERTAELTRANQEIQRFAYIVSHDLRSPLVNVMGFTGELEAATKPLSALVDAAEADAPAILTEDMKLAAREDLPEAIRFIRASTQKMDRLINAILKLSREGGRVLAPERLDLALLIDGIVATLRHRLDAAGAEVTVARAMPALTADRLAIEQILSNLIENAVKYLKQGGPGRIAIAAEAVDGRVIVSVADNGRGIDPRDHDRIFDLFRRSGAQDQPGEGIGLAHVRALAYRLGGSVDCQSALGEGATFRLTLPASPRPVVEGSAT